MELLPEGKNFRLVGKEELPEILNVLEEYLLDSLKFHQTVKTYLKDFVWEFYFYVSKDWPNDPICLHFPGMTNSPNGLLYESFSVFCPESRLDLLTLLEEEDILLDWSKPIYLNFTHTKITERLESFYENIGTVEKVIGDIYLCEKPMGETQPYVVIRPENDASKSLYTKLGFRKIYQTARVVFKPYDPAY